MQSVRTLENLEHLKTLAGPRDGRLCTFCRTLRTSSYMYSRFQQGCGFRVHLLSTYYYIHYVAELPGCALLTYAGLGTWQNGHRFWIPHPKVT